MLKVNLTETEILNIVSQERLMEFYLNITPGQDIVTNPLRKDNKPGCSFWKNPSTGILYFKDWALNEAYTAVQVVMKKYNLSYYRAISKINIDLPRISADKDKDDIYLEPAKRKLVQVVVKPKFEKHELNYWAKYGIDEPLLRKYQVDPIKQVFVNKELKWTATKSNPIFGYYFPESSKVKVYRPLNKDKEYKWMSSCKETDIIGNELYVKGKPKHNILIITSSGKDAMVLNSFGFPAISPIAEGVKIKPEIMQKLFRYYKYVFVFMDSDKTGLNVNENYKNLYPNIYPIHIPIHYNTKDVSDFRANTNHKKTFNLIKKLIKEAVTPRASQIPF